MRLTYFLLVGSLAFIGQGSSQLTAGKCDLLNRVKISLNITETALKRPAPKIQDWLPGVVTQWKNFNEVCFWQGPMHVEPCSTNDIFRLFTNMMLLTAWDYKQQLDYFVHLIPDFFGQFLPLNMLDKLKTANLQQFAVFAQDVNVVDFIVNLAPVVKNPPAFILIYLFYYVIFVQRW